MTLTDRQKKILMAIIEEYMKDPSEVGSASLVKRYKLNVSSATVRNEMVKLMDKGFLDKSHISSGRLPTDMAFRMYVNEVVKERMRDHVKMVKIRQGIFRVRFSPEELIREILSQLVEHSKSASFIVLDDTSRYYGVSSLMRFEELKNIHSLQRVLDLLEDEHLLRGVFSKYDGDQVTVLIGSELGIEDLDDYSMVFTKFDFWDNRSGHMGVVGSKRMDYQTVIPSLLAVRNSLADSLKGWK